MRKVYVIPIMKYSKVEFPKFMQTLQISGEDIDDSDDAKKRRAIDVFEDDEEETSFWH